jgi:hypothetical protein
MMICTYCGKENPEDSSTCDFCGAWLEDVDKENKVEILPPIPATEPEPSPLKSDESIDQPSDQAEISPEGQTAGIEKPAEPIEPFTIEQPEPPTRRQRRGCDKYIWWFVGCFVVLCLSLSCITLIWGFYSFSSALDFLKPATPIPFQTPISTVPFSQVATDTPPITPSQIPSSTSLPPIANPTNPPLLTPEVLYFDDFSNPNSGWDKVNESDYSTDYYNNAYRIVENDAKADVWANPDSLSFGDVIIEVDAIKNGGPDDNDFGIICRYQDVDRFYYGIISSDGYYGIIKVSSGGSETLGRDYLEYSDSINQGYVSNYIRFDCIGDALTLYANGDLLDLQTDAEYASGNVGLIAGTYDTPGTDILFDNFTVQEP